MILRTFTRNVLRLNRITELKPVELLVCMDLECTCDSPVQIEPMEIIEIACLKMDLTKPEPVENRASFHSYAKPKYHPQLTLFCQDLTGITQATIDKSETIDKVVERFMAWLRAENIVGGDRDFAFVSCGKLDRNLLCPMIKETYNHDLPWIDVKRTFVGHKRQWPKSLYHMLELLGGEPSGRLHSAQDDCKNLAKVVDLMHKDGCKFNINNKMPNL